MASPDPIGTVRLSLIGEGRTSISIPIKAPTRAFKGFTKIKAPIKAGRNPKTEPSTFFPLLKGKVILPNFLPKRVAELSPSASTAIAA